MGDGEDIGRWGWGGGLAVESVMERRDEMAVVDSVDVWSSAGRRRMRGEEEEEGSYWTTCQTANIGVLPNTRNIYRKTDL